MQRCGSRVPDERIEWEAEKFFQYLYGLPFKDQLVAIEALTHHVSKWWNNSLEGFQQLQHTAVSMESSLLPFDDDNNLITISRRNEPEVSEMKTENYVALELEGTSTNEQLYSNAYIAGGNESGIGLQDGEPSGSGDLPCIIKVESISDTEDPVVVVRPDEQDPPYVKARKAKGKTRAEIQKAYRERLKAKLGEEYNRKERERVKRNRKTKLRKRVSRRRKSDALNVLSSGEQIKREDTGHGGYMKETVHVVAGISDVTLPIGKPLVVTLPAIQQASKSKRKRKS